MGVCIYHIILNLHQKLHINHMHVHSYTSLCLLTIMQYIRLVYIYTSSVLVHFMPEEIPRWNKLLVLLSGESVPSTGSSLLFLGRGQSHPLTIPSHPRKKSQCHSYTHPTITTVANPKITITSVRTCTHTTQHSRKTSRPELVLTHRCKTGPRFQPPC